MLKKKKLNPMLCLKSKLNPMLCLKFKLNPKLKPRTEMRTGMELEHEQLDKRTVTGVSQLELEKIKMLLVKHLIVTAKEKFD